MLTGLRNGVGMTQAQAAERLGIDQTTVARIELGDWAVPTDQLVDFFWAYHESLQNLEWHLRDFPQAIFKARREAGARKEGDGEE